MSDGPWATPFRLEAGETSIVGSVRDHNEDAACAIPEIGLVAVADGLGGHNAGERASGLAIEVLQERLTTLHEAGTEPSLEGLFKVFDEANKRILSDAEENPERAGMGTTLTMVLVTGSRVLLAHIGDSRAWRIRDGEIEQLTRDHTLVGQQVRDGILTEEQAEIHPMRHVLSRCLGIQESIEVDLAEGDVALDDIYILASDGLVHGLDKEAIAKLVAEGGEAAETATSLVESACAIDGQDNITAAVLVCRES